MSIELISGRFDPPHLGHMITIGRERRIYDALIIVILDDGQQHFPVAYRRDILTEAVDLMGKSDSIRIDTCKTHFGKITKEEISQWRFDVYGSGNMEVLRHIDSLEIPCHYITRAYDYSAVDERIGRTVANLLH